MLEPGPFDWEICCYNHGAFPLRAMINVNMERGARTQVSCLSSNHICGDSSILGQTQISARLRPIDGPSRMIRFPSRTVIKLASKTIQLCACVQVLSKTTSEFCVLVLKQGDRLLSNRVLQETICSSVHVKGPDRQTAAYIGVGRIVRINVECRNGGISLMLASSTNRDLRVLSMPMDTGANARRNV